MMDIDEVPSVECRLERANCVCVANSITLDKFKVSDKAGSL